MDEELISDFDLLFGASGNKKKPFFASASSIKLYESCTLKYYYNRILHLPEEQNSGALMGSAAHTVLECLLKTRHLYMFYEILESGTIDNCAAVQRYIHSYIKKVDLLRLDPDAYKKISGFIVRGLSYDFFNKKGNGSIIGAEIPFEIGSEEDGYFVRGFIDRLAIYDGKTAGLRDFKSSKRKFEGKDIKENIQALIYALAVKKLYPELNLKIVVDFLFLAFPLEEMRQRFEVSNKQLKELEEYLRDVYKKMANFQPRDRWSNPAANNPPPEDGSFGGKLSCGFAKYKGHVKKDGSKLIYHCPYRFNYNYFAIINKDGGIIKTNLKKENLKPKDEEVIKEMEFAGCERFIKKNV